MKLKKSKDLFINVDGPFNICKMMEIHHEKNSQLHH